MLLGDRYLTGNWASDGSCLTGIYRDGGEVKMGPVHVETQLKMMFMLLTDLDCCGAKNKVKEDHARTTTNFAQSRQDLAQRRFLPLVSIPVAGGSIV